MALFTEINRLKADLDALRPLAPEQEQQVLQKFRLEWNYNSNAIEGNSLTLGETRSLLLHGLTAAGKPMRDHIDIKGHNEAVLWLEDFVRDERPLTEQFIRGMHEVLLGEAYYASAQTATGQPTRKMIVPGQYKQQPNNVLTATGEMFYFASPEETPARMTDLVDWYRQEEAAPTMPPAALAAEFHYRFVRIHPFDDGNGRMSRLLMNLILLRHGYPMTVIKATDRNPYLAALAAADAGDPEPFLRFIIENVEAGLRLMIRAAQGESIDEPDDLDKKLALLKKQVLSHNNTIKTLWNDETQISIFEKLIEHWLDDLNLQTQGFDELFMNSSYTSTIYSILPTPTIFNDDDYLHFKNTFQNTLLTASAEIDVINFSKKWHHFRQINNGFNIGALIAFNFKNDHFIVNAAVVDKYLPESLRTHWYSSNIFNSVYTSEYDWDTIHKINYQIANKLYDFIAAKVAEADMPLT